MVRALLSKEASGFIRAEKATYAPRIVIMTALYINVRYRNEARLKYGIDHYLVKPLSRPALEEVLRFVPKVPQPVGAHSILLLSTPYLPALAPPYMLVCSLPPP